MSDYKFEILTELVKYDDFKDNRKLFGKNVEKYEIVLRYLFDNKLIDRIIIEEKGTEQTKITNKGRIYYYDSLLPTRNPAIYPIKLAKQSIITRVRTFIVKHVWLSIITLVSFIAGLIKIYEFLVNNNWWGLGKK